MKFNVSILLFYSTLSPALELGNTGVQVILDYSYVLKKLTQVSSLSNETEVILQYVLYQSAFLENNFNNNLTVSDQLLYSVESQSVGIQQLLQIFNLSVMQEAVASRNVSSLNDTATRLEVDVTGLCRATDLVLLDAYSCLTQVDNEVNVIQNVSAELSSSLPIILNTTQFTSEVINKTQSVSLL